MDDFMAYRFVFVEEGETVFTMPLWLLLLPLAAVPVYWYGAVLMRRAVKACAREAKAMNKTPWEYSPMGVPALVTLVWLFSPVFVPAYAVTALLLTKVGKWVGGDPNNV